MMTDRPAIIVETIAIDAPPEKVYAALTEADQVPRWWGDDHSHRITEMRADLRVGGAWESLGVTQTGEPFSVRGVYRVVDPPRCLEFTWRPDWNDGDVETETLVRYDIEPHDGRTRVRVTHSGFTSQSDRDGHARGWALVLGWLRDYASR